MEMPGPGLERHCGDGGNPTLLPFEPGPSGFSHGKVAERISAWLKSRLAEIRVCFGRRGHHAGKGDSDPYCGDRRRTDRPGGASLRSSPKRFCLRKRASGGDRTRASNPARDSRVPKFAEPASEEASIPRAPPGTACAAREDTSCERDAVC